jgi:hypothetical protein
VEGHPRRPVRPSAGPNIDRVPLAVASCMSRQGQPTRSTWSMPLRKRRLSPAGRATRPRSGERPINSHSASDKSPRPGRWSSPARRNRTDAHIGGIDPGVAIGDKTSQRRLRCRAPPLLRRARLAPRH